MSYRNENGHCHDVDFSLPLRHVVAGSGGGNTDGGGTPPPDRMTETVVEHVGVLPESVDYRHLIRLRPKGGVQELVLADEKGRLGRSGREFVDNA